MNFKQKDPARQRERHGEQDMQRFLRRAIRHVEQQEDNHEHDQE